MEPTPTSSPFTQLRQLAPKHRIPLASEADKELCCVPAGPAPATGELLSARQLPFEHVAPDFAGSLCPTGAREQAKGPGLATTASLKC
mmetsp:Transcript_143/g.526  ORF Transcript_143/g.526 Transcript_143/m.526 type:complete len:88 (+) Transcript_143:754-1017(+)